MLNYDITIQKGSQFELSLVWKEGDPAAAVDLTGYTALMHVRPYPESDETPLIILTDTDGISLGGISGEIVITVNETKTNLANPCNAKWDLRLKNGSGIPRYIIGGKCTITQMVSRD